MERINIDLVIVCDVSTVLRLEMSNKILAGGDESMNMPSQY